MLLFHTATVLSVSWFFVAPYVVRLPTAVAKSTNNVNLKNSRWEESRIWPAPSVELYDTVYHTVLLRTFVCSHWALELIGNHSDSVHDILHAAEARFGQFLEIGTPSLASNDSYYPVNPDGAELAALDGIRIEIFNNKTASSDFRLHHDVDESYQIHIAYPINTTAITSGNWIEIQSETVVGALRALETVKQLLQFAWMENDNAVAVYVIRDTPLYIQDSPEYPYRGLMIDTARHYLSVDLIVSNLYVMAANKLNALHWHMTDSQSWPYDSAAFPELAASGAYCVECHYTKDQIQSVIDEASLLGIRVIVEVDLPGHSQGTIKTSLCGDWPAIWRNVLCCFNSYSYYRFLR